MCILRRIKKKERQREEEEKGNMQERRRSETREDKDDGDGRTDCGGERALSLIGGVGTWL